MIQASISYYSPVRFQHAFSLTAPLSKKLLQKSTKYFLVSLALRFLKRSACRQHNCGWMDRQNVTYYKIIILNFHKIKLLVQQSLLRGSLFTNRTASRWNCFNLVQNIKTLLEVHSSDFKNKPNSSTSHCEIMKVRLYRCS